MASRKPIPKPLSLDWVGTYIRLWYDRSKGKFAEGIVEKSYVGFPYPESCVLRSPDSPGFSVLHEGRDFERIEPTPELLKALEQDALRRAIQLAERMAPQSTARAKEVDRAIQALITPENAPAIEVLRTALRDLLITLEKEIVQDYATKVKEIQENVDRLKQGLRDAYTGALHAEGYAAGGKS